MSAGIALQLLTAHAQGVPARENADNLNIPRPTANKWLAAGRWQAENLATRLSKMPDYAQFRAQLEPLVARLGLHAGALPEPPERGRAKMDALVLRSALEALVAHRERTGGRGRKLSQPALTEQLRQQGFQISMWTLADWLTADGRLKTAPSSVANLPGFADEGEAILQALSALGHDDLATEVADAVPGELKAVTARDITAALEALAESPQQGLSKVCLDQGLSVSITKYFNTSGRPRAGVETVAAMPDFAEHRDAIVAALARLGHEADAASLPAVAMPLRDAHDELSRHFDGVVQAFAVMRSQPPLSLLDAAHVAGISAQLLSVLASADGALQDRAAIDDRITGDHALMRPAMAGMLDRLQTVLAGGPEQAPGAAPLKKLRLPGAGSAPDRTLIVLPDSNDPGPHVADRLRQIFYADPLAIRAPRSYADERPRQALRWLATVLLQQFRPGVEVQCYFHRGMRQIVVSSNVDQVNNELRDFLAGGGMESLLAGDGQDAATADTRPQRHQARLSHAMGDFGNTSEPELDEILAAIAERRFQVPARSYGRAQKTVDLHAERRIMAFVKMLARDFDAQRLAGTRRPCGACAEVVELPDEGTRGPFWHSQNAKAGTDTKSLIARNVDASIRTSITETRAGRLTFDTNTDSDSDG